MSRRHVAATNRFVCTGEFLWKSLSLQQNFVAATCCKNSNQTEFVRLVAATKFCCRDEDFYKISLVHTKLFDAALCRRNMLLQLVARSVHIEWCVAATCCRNLSPRVKRHVAATLRGNKSLRVYRSGDNLLQQVEWLVAATNRFVCTGEFMCKSLS